MTNKPAKEAYRRLSDKEKEIVALAAEGLTDNEIAKRIFASKSSVRQHLTAIYGKLEIAGSVKRPKSLLGQIHASAQEAQTQDRSSAQQTSSVSLSRRLTNVEGIFSPVSQWFASPGEEPVLTKADWIGGIRWEDVAEGNVYRRPEIDLVLQRLQADRSVLVVGGIGWGRTTTALICARELSGLGWQAYWCTEEPGGGLSPERVIGDMRQGSGARLYVFANTDRHREFYADVIELAADLPDDVRVLLLSRNYYVDEHHADTNSPMSLLEPLYIQPPQNVVGALVGHVCDRVGLPRGASRQVWQAQRYPTLWFATRAVAHCVHQAKPRFQPPTAEALVLWQYETAIQPRLRLLEPTLRETWSQLALLGSLGLRPAASWWPTDVISNATRRLILDELVSLGLAQYDRLATGVGEDRPVSIGPVELCVRLSLIDCEGSGLAEPRVLSAVLREFVLGGNILDPSVLFNALANQERRDVATSLFVDPGVRSWLTASVKLMSAQFAVRLVSAVARCDRAMATSLLRDRGADDIARSLLEAHLDVRGASRAIDAIREVDPVSARLVVSTLLGQRDDSPLHSLNGQAVHSSPLVQLALASPDPRLFGFLLRAVAHCGRQFGSLLLDAFDNWIWSSPGELAAKVVDSPLSAQLAILRGVQLTDPEFARRVLRAFPRASFAASLASRFGSGGLRQSLDIIGRIDQEYLSDLAPLLSNDTLPAGVFDGRTIGQIASDLEAIFDAAPPLGAQLLAGLDESSLRAALERERDLRNIGRAIGRLRRVNQVRLRRFLRHMGPEHLTRLTRSCPYQTHVGIYFLVLAAADQSIAKDVLRGLTDEDLQQKVSARQRLVSGLGLLVQGIASCDRNRASRLYRSQFQRLENSIERNLNLPDASRGLLLIGETLPTEGNDLIRRFAASLRAMLQGSPDPRHVTRLLRGITACTSEGEETAIAILDGKDGWLASQAVDGIDPAVLGQYLAAVAKIRPKAASIILGKDKLWQRALDDARSSAATGKLSQLLYGVAAADHASRESRALTAVRAKLIETLVDSLAERLTEPRTSLATRTLQAIGGLRGSLPDVADSFIVRAMETGALQSRAMGARNCQELSEFLAALHQLAPPPHNAVQNIIELLADDTLPRLISRERLVWRLVWLADTLRQMVDGNSLDPKTASFAWRPAVDAERRDVKASPVSRGVDFVNVTERLIWERRLRVSALLLRRLNGQAPKTAAAIVTEMPRAWARNREFVSHAVGSGEVGAGALVLATCEVSQVVGNQLWLLMKPSILANRQDQRLPKEIVWLALAVSGVDQEYAGELVRQGGADDVPPDVAAWLAVVADYSRVDALEDLRPDHLELLHFIHDGDVDAIRRAVALVGWQDLLASQEIEQGTQSILGSAASEGAREGLSRWLPVQANQGGLIALYSRRWDWYDFWWAAPVKWLEPDEEFLDPDWNET